MRRAAGSARHRCTVPPPALGAPAGSWGVGSWGLTCGAAHVRAPGSLRPGWQALDFREHAAGGLITHVPTLKVQGIQAGGQAPHHQVPLVAGRGEALLAAPGGNGRGATGMGAWIWLCPEQDLPVGGSERPPARPPASAPQALTGKRQLHCGGWPQPGRPSPRNPCSQGEGNGV